MATNRPPDALRQLRSLRWRIRLLGGFLVIWTVLILAWLLPLGVRFAGATIFGIAGATFGYIRARRLGLRAVDPAPSDKDLPPLEKTTILWGMSVGAIGYAGLAAFGIGVPSPDAPLTWRLIGGLVFGSIGGIAAGFLLPLLEIVAGLVFRKRAA